MYLRCMENNNTNTGDAQGAKAVPERKPSKLYAMKAFKQASEKLSKLNMVNKEQEEALKKINNALLNGYLMGETDEENDLDK